MADDFEKKNIQQQEEGALADDEVETVSGGYINTTGVLKRPVIGSRRPVTSPSDIIDEPDLPSPD